jgi:hypothetical protein
MSKHCMLIGVLGVLTFGACSPDDTAETAGTETASETGNGDGDGDGDGDGECTPPPGVFGDCAAGLDACMTDGPKLCVSDSQDSPTIAVCARRCTEVCDCWGAPTDGTAAVACVTLDQSGDNTCVLDCTNGETCPTGMSCSNIGGSVDLCMFDQ